MWIKSAADSQARIDCIFPIPDMRTVITYGTFDLLHKGHLNLLKRARDLGDYLIVGVTTDHYDRSRGKLNVVQDIETRIEGIRQTGLANLIIREEMEGQKVHDIKKYGVDVFVLGSDWTGKFDYLSDFCKVVYLERTQGISSTELRNHFQGVTNLGIVGCGRIAKRFVEESRFISAVEITCVCGRDVHKTETFTQECHIPEFTTNYDAFLESVDAVYIALPHHLHYEYALRAIRAGKHVLCEKPMALCKRDAVSLFNEAAARHVVLAEAFKTAYAPAFQQLCMVALSGAIGNIKAVDAAFTKLIADRNGREFDPTIAGGAFTELGGYPLLAVSAILGQQPASVQFVAAMGEGVDEFTRAWVVYPHAVANCTVGIGVKREGDLCIAGTDGYIYVPAPWWKTSEFEVRYENPIRNKKYFYQFAGDGLRYELAAFVDFINGRAQTLYGQMKQHSIFTAEIMEAFREHRNVTEI